MIDPDEETMSETEDIVQYLQALFDTEGRGLPDSSQALFKKWRSGQLETSTILNQQRELRNKKIELERLDAQLEHRKTLLAGQNEALSQLLFETSTPELRASVLQVAQMQKEDPGSEEASDGEPDPEDGQASEEASAE